MAQTECTVSPQVVAGASLQISPNLEALLQHDELTRRGAGSPTSIACSTPSSEFAVSLPPPPPRNMHAGKKASPSETRKDVRRRRSFNFKSDSWPDALAPDTAASPANPAIPNPYINPAPVVARFDSPTDGTHSSLASSAHHLTWAFRWPSDTQAGRHTYIQTAVYSVPVRASCSCGQYTRTRTPPHPDIHQPPFLSYVAQGRAPPDQGKGFPVYARNCGRLWQSEAQIGQRRRRPQVLSHRELGIVPRPSRQVRRSASQGPIPLNVKFTDSPMRQDSVSRQPRLFNTSVTFGNDDAALLDPVGVPIKNKLPPSPLARRYPACDHPTHSELSPTRSLSTSSASSSSSSVHASSANPVHTYPAWSLPNLTFPSMTFNELPRSQSSHSVADSDSRNSFIDLCPPDGVSPRTQGVGHTRPHRQKPSALVIPPSNIYQGPPSNVSSMSLATMIFAPPSPTIDVSPLQHRPSSPSASSIALSTMVFAPPSPATELSPLAVRPSISPSSADSLTPIEFASPASPFSGRRGTLEIPTARKFSSLRVGRKAGEKRSLSLSPRPESQVLAPLPPTTNFLGPDERADLIRRNRKLTQVFGQTPGAEVGPLDVPVYKKLKRPPAALTSLLSAGKQRNHRQVMSVSNATSPSHRKTAPSSPWQTDDLWSPTGRRHSTPLTPTSPFTFCLDDTPQAASTSDHHGVHSLTQSPRNSSSSFIDLSDDDDETSRVGDTSVIGSLERKGGRRLIYHSSSTPSLVESLDPDRKAEVERRRMRDKVAKLHRFLGSRVPPDLVLGSTAVPPSPFSDPSSSLSTMEGLRDTLLWGRKGGPSSYQQLFDRGKEELDHKEKAVNVRRAQKMEKVCQMALGLHSLKWGFLGIWDASSPDAFPHPSRPFNAFSTVVSHCPGSHV